MMQPSNSEQTWTLKEVKAHLAQILSLAETEEPQYISADQADGQGSEEHKAFVVVLADVWQKKDAPEKQLSEKHLGKWLVENTPLGTNLKGPEYDDSGRFIAFSDIVFDER